MRLATGFCVAFCRSCVPFSSSAGSAGFCCAQTPTEKSGIGYKWNPNSFCPLLAWKFFMIGIFPLDVGVDGLARRAGFSEVFSLTYT